MTRKDAMNIYDVDARGIICSPGKFEGEPIYVPVFWEAGLDGAADDDDSNVFGFDLTVSDVTEWPELADVTRLELWEDSNGFVYCDRLPQDETENERIERTGA